MLTSEQIRKYEEDGYLVLPAFVERKACDRLRNHAEELLRDFEPQEVVSIFSTRQQTRTSDDYFLESGDKIRFFFEENAFDANGILRQSKERSINKIGHALHDLDPVFDEFSRCTAVKELARALGFSDPRLLQSMYIFKQPNIGGEVSCHQDATFLFTKPLRVLGLWFALENATIENGCLWAIPGGHKAGLKSRFLRASVLAEGSEAGYRPPVDPKTYFQILDDTPWPEDELIPLEVEEGTLIVLHPLLPHLSRENRSPKSRHAYTLHIIDSSADYPKENWLQRSPDMPLRGL